MYGVYGNHFEANDIVGVLAGSPVCFLIFSSPDLRNDMPHLLFAEVDIYTALSNTQQMLHCFFSPHEQYSTACLLWYFAILNLDYPIPKIFFFQIVAIHLLQFHGTNIQYNLLQAC